MAENKINTFPISKIFDEKCSHSRQDCTLNRKEKVLIMLPGGTYLDNRMIMNSGSNWFSEAVDDLLLISFCC